MFKDTPAKIRSQINPGSLFIDHGVTTHCPEIIRAGDEVQGDLLIEDHLPAITFKAFGIILTFTGAMPKISPST